MFPRYLGDRMVLGAGILILFMAIFGFGAFQAPKLKAISNAQRTECKQGCKSTACKRSKCGTSGDASCKAGYCRGCWKKSETVN